MLVAPERHAAPDGSGAFLAVRALLRCTGLSVRTAYRTGSAEASPGKPNDSQRVTSVRSYGQATLLLPAAALERTPGRVTLQRAATCKVSPPVTPASSTRAGARARALTPARVRWRAQVTGAHWRELSRDGERWHVCGLAHIRINPPLTVRRPGQLLGRGGAGCPRGSRPGGERTD